jgi:predicted phage terminase large subunit-like protein
MRRLLQSSWYQSNWPHVQLASDQNTKSRFELTSSGHRIAIGTGGSATGEGGDRLLIDDPHNVAEVESTEVRKGVLSWHDEVWSTRANNPHTTARVVIGQRVHEQDLIGHLPERGGWEHLNLPAEFEPQRRCVTSLGWSDPRTQAGELLWPQRFGPEEIKTAKLTLGSYGFSAQFQQRPAPAGGGLLKSEWWRYWSQEPAGLTGHLLSVDCSFKGTSDSDFVVIQCWAKQSANRYLLDQFRKLDFPGTLAALKAMCRKWPQAYRVVIEEKANGAALIATAKSEIPGLIPYSPKESKEARVSAISAQIESGCVYLPDPHLFPWVNDFVSECNSFPRAPHDDMVDAMSQALIHLSGPERRWFSDEQIDALTAPDITKPQAKPRQFFIEGLYRG